MNKSKIIVTALAALFALSGIAQAASGPFGYDLQKDMHRTRDKEQQKADALEKARENVKNKSDKMQEDIMNSKDIDEAKSKFSSQYKEIMKAYCEELAPYATPEENAYCQEWTNLDPTAYGVGTDMVLLINKMFYLPNTPKAFYSFVPRKDLFVDSVSHDRVYYTNPTMKSAVTRYNQGNYTGCLQELYDYTKKNPNDPYAYYYMGLAYTKIGEKKAAQNCYQKVINCNVHGTLLKSALKSRDCLSGGPFCMWDETMSMLEEGMNEIMDSTDISADDELDKFIKAPYQGNGFSPELEKQFKQKELENVQKTINRKKELNESDFEKIQKLNDFNKSEILTGEKIAMVTGADNGLTPSDSDVSDAIDVLRRSGLNITVQNPVAEQSAFTQTSFESTPEVFTPNTDLQNWNMLFGNTNSSKNDPMMTMLPYMMQDSQNGKNIDPKLLQTMMMNSMMSGLDGLNSSDNK